MSSEKISGSMHPPKDAIDGFDLVGEITLTCSRCGAQHKDVRKVYYTCRECDEVFRITFPKEDWVLLNPEKIDWQGLLGQKEALIDMRTKMRGKDVEQWNSWFNALTGLLHFLDYVQDQAAEVLGEEAVFGPQEWKLEEEKR